MTTTASTAVIRQWARERGIAVGDRGRLAPQVLAAYSAASIGPAPTGADPRPAAARTRSHTTSAGPRLTIRPTPGATGIGRRVRARSS